MSELVCSKIVIDDVPYGLVEYPQGTTIADIIAVLGLRYGLEGYGPEDLSYSVEFTPDQPITGGAPDSIYIKRVTDPAYVHAFPSQNPVAGK